MFSPKQSSKSKSKNAKPLKLPQIISKKKIQTQNKKMIDLKALPKIPKHNKNKNASLNKENNSDNYQIHRKVSLQRNVIERVKEVQIADQFIHNILGPPQTTLNLGGDMTNFQYKIQIHRNLIRKNRLKTNQMKSAKQIKQKSEVQVQKNVLSSKQIKNLQENNPTLDKNQNFQNIQVEQNPKLMSKRIQSERKMKSMKKLAILPTRDQHFFKEIKQILDQNPQKQIAQKKKVKFTIQQLQQKLKKLNNQNGNQQDQQNQNKLARAKSMGMIALAQVQALKDQYTFQNWDKIKLNEQNKSENQLVGNTSKCIIHHKSNFQSQMDHIQMLQNKNLRSIQKMVENRKLLIDLKLLNYNIKSIQKNKK